MPKIIRGTKDAKGTTIIRGGTGGLRRIRCSSCHAMAGEQVLPNGRTAYVCQCGAQYNVTPMK